jgi:hypothetical protein
MYAHDATTGIRAPQGSIGLRENTLRALQIVSRRPDFRPWHGPT